MILERYLVRALAVAIGASLLGLVTVLVAVHLAEQAGQLAGEAGALAALRLSGLFAVVQGYQMLPLAGFLATLITGAVLARRGELLAMLGSGMRPRRLWGVFVAVVVTVAGVGIAWGEILAPGAAAAIQRLYQTELDKGPGRLNAFFTRRHQWFSLGDLVLFLPFPGEDGRAVFREPVVYRFAEGLVSEVIEARELFFEADGWLLGDARTYSASGTPCQARARLPLALAASPRDLIDVTGNPRQMASGDVWRLIDRRARAGFDTTAHRVELHSRFAHPLLGLCLFLVAAPWVLAPTRRRSLAVALGGGVVVIALAVAVGQIFRVLALGGSLPTPLGAWGAHLLCLLLAPLTARMHRRYRW